MSDEKIPEDPQIILYPLPTGKGEVTLTVREGQVWVTQAQIAEIFGTSVSNASYHIGRVLKEGELSANSVIKQYLTTAVDGKDYSTYFYSLDMVLAVGFRVRGTRGVLFRQWANRHLKEFLIKGFVIDDERLKNPDGRPDYFDELLARIRDIRASEKRFYQKIRDLFALSSDYRADDKATQMFFAETQNKLIYAVTKKTAAEILVARANPDEPNMGLRSWQGNIVRKQDILIAKNYLTADELDQLNRLVSIFLDSAEMRVKDRKDLTLDYWRGSVVGLLQFSERPVLAGKGSVSKDRAEKIVKERYAAFDKRRREEEARLADEDDLAYLKEVQKKLDHRKKEG